MEHQNDLFYIEKVLAGDTQSFGILVQRYQNMVFALSLKMLKHREEAEEVAQDTFVKAYKSIAKFKGDSKFSTWMYRIAYNTCLDRIKGNVKFNNNVEINDVTSNELEAVEHIFEGIERKERSEIIQGCMNQLPDEERVIVHLFYFEEQSLKEIEEITQLTASNIKVKLHRARKKLFSIFKNSVEHEIYSHYEQRAKG
ncbi:MAG: RNA polymerase [Bacteroidetes bacterium MedPE-SWsnd-G1]|nr:MAG: RNA polymerase [Bacteroidetes bacterium MedPE-SWsnd-G1]